MHPIIFTGAASAELTAAQDWYEKEAPSLGRRFRKSIDISLERISANPLHFPIVHKNIRRALLHRFPYAFLFVITPDETAHCHCLFPWQPQPCTLADQTQSTCLTQKR